MRNLVDILDHSANMSRGRTHFERRFPPVLVAHGAQELYSLAATRLREDGFLICDVSAGDYERAIADLDVSWPLSRDQPLEDAYGLQVKSEEAKLAILAGRAFRPRFWRNLREFGALYLGSTFPPIARTFLMCRIVPDVVEVVTLAKDEDLESHAFTDLENRHYFNAIEMDNDT